MVPIVEAFNELNIYAPVPGQLKGFHGPPANIWWDLFDGIQPQTYKPSSRAFAKLQCIHNFHLYLHQCNLRNRQGVINAMNTQTGNMIHGRDNFRQLPSNQAIQKG